MHFVKANGATIPALGFGTFLMKPAEVADVLPAALKLGFRHVDTAQVYDNETAVGAALQASGVPRDEIFLTTKVWVTRFAPKEFLPSVEQSLKKLKTDYVDLLLLHWPHGSDTPLEAQIAALNETVTKGMARHIGVSNYTTALMRKAVQISKAPLVTNQVEYHPYLSQTPVLKTCADLGLSLTAFFAMAKGEVPRDPTLREIGAAHGKSAAQVALRWLLQQDGVVALSKTAKTERLRENFAVFDFELSGDEMQRIFSLARPGSRLANPPDLAPQWD